MRNRLCRSAVLPLCVVAVAGMFGCTYLPDTAAVVEIDYPSRGEFAVVSPVLVGGCGTIDCHGNKFRNFRLVGEFTTRLDTGNNPSSPRTTDAELDANYDSLVSLEPEKLTAVVRGTHIPEYLTLVRKARGTEFHKAGKRWDKDSDADKCLVSWLTKQLDEDACRAANK